MTQTTAGGLVRVTAYVPQRDAEVLAEAAEALGQTRSALLAEVLSNTVPVLEVLRDLATTVSSGSAKMRDVMAQFAADMEPLVHETEGRYNELLKAAEGPG